MLDELWQSEHAATLGRLGAAFLLALPIAFDRERADHIMGLRTFPLVAMATCAFTLLGLHSHFAESPEALARIVQGLITGIGFIGGGAILRNDDRILGTATAASIWLVGAVGIAVALDEYVIAVSLSLANFAVLRFLGRLKRRLRDEE